MTTVARAKRQRGCLFSMPILGPVDYVSVKTLELIEQRHALLKLKLKKKLYYFCQP